MIQNLTKNEEKEYELNCMEIKAFVNTDWCYKQSLLHLAVLQDNMILIKQCFFYGIDVNKVDFYGNTALYYCRSLEVVKFLVGHGADVDVLNSDGQTAVVYLYERRNHDIIKYLIPITDLDLTGIKSRSYTLLDRMIYHGEEDLSLLKIVINGTKNLNRIDDRGDSCLTRAAQMKKNKDVIMLLVESGVDLYIRNSDGKNFYDLSNKQVQKIIEKKYPEFMRLKDMTEPQRQEYHKQKHLNSLDINEDNNKTTML